MLFLIMNDELLYNTLRRMKFTKTEMLCQDLHIPEIYKGRPFVKASARDMDLGLLGKYEFPEKGEHLEIHIHDNIGSISARLIHTCGKDIKTAQVMIPPSNLERDGYVEYMFERLEHSMKKYVLSHD